jgi:hypothetical protein
MVNVHKAASRVHSSPEDNLSLNISTKVFYGIYEKTCGEND